LLPKDGADKVGSAAHVKRKPLRVEELDRAEKTILKLVQRCVSQRNRSFAESSTSRL